MAQCTSLDTERGIDKRMKKGSASVVNSEFCVWNKLNAHHSRVQKISEFLLVLLQVALVPSLEKEG